MWRPSICICRIPEPEGNEACPPAAANPASTGSSPTYAARPSPRHRSSCDQAHGDGLSNEGSRGSQKTISSKHSTSPSRSSLRCCNDGGPLLTSASPEPRARTLTSSPRRLGVVELDPVVRVEPFATFLAPGHGRSFAFKQLVEEPGYMADRSRHDQSRAVASGSVRPLFSRSQATTAASAGRSKSRASKIVPSRSNAIRVSGASDASSSLVPSIGRPSDAATGLVFTYRSSPASNARP